MNDVIEKIVTENVEEHREEKSEWRREDAEFGNVTKTPNKRTNKNKRP